MIKNLEHLCFDKDGVLIDVHAYWKHTTEIRANYLKNKLQLNSIQKNMLIENMAILHCFLPETESGNNHLVVLCYNNQSLHN